MRYEIISVEPKTDKNGKGYYRLKGRDTNNTEIWMTDFSSGTYKVKEFWDIEIETNKSGDKVFHNVKSKTLMIGVKDKEQMATDYKEMDKETKVKSNGVYPKDPIGLAIEVFIDQPADKKNMVLAIEDVKQAQQAFK